MNKLETGPTGIDAGVEGAAARLNAEDAMTVSEDEIEVTAIVTADGDGNGFAALLTSYVEAMEAHGAPYELICIYDHASAGVSAAVAEVKEKWPKVQDISLRPWASEDTALKIGVDQARGELILTLPGWSDFDPKEIGRMIGELGDDDMVTGRRDGYGRSALQRVRMGATHGMIRLFFGQTFRDVFCRLRVGRAEMFRKIADLGVRQHFLPVVAISEGYRVREAPVAPGPTSPADPTYSFKPWAHITALVDVMTLYVGLKFLRRPLRFFGAVGLPIFLLGMLALAYLVVSRLMFGEPLADRPALVFAVMMIVLGLQIIALGLIGEIVIFSSTRRMRSYEIQTIIRGRPTDEETREDAARGS
ncbi:MAG: glycosyl transferase family 2 [Pseudomonadota bacterium]